MSSKCRFTADEKREVLALVTRTRERTRSLDGWTLRHILEQLAVAPSRYRDWVERGEAGTLTDRTSAAPAREAILPEEKSAVYALTHPKDGYRRLAWQMIDADVAYLSPTSIYRILRDSDLLYR